jgi:hypothetical protein
MTKHQMRMDQAATCGRRDECSRLAIEIAELARKPEAA